MLIRTKDEKKKDWSEMKLEGFKSDVTGIIFSKEFPAENGMPLGGVDTGCIDIETDGTIGFISTFNSLTPRRGPLNMPFMGVSFGAESMILSTNRYKNYPEESATPSFFRRGAPVDDIRYMGHYPMLDMDYVFEGPIKLSSRMYTPFVPGDVKLSNTPGSVIEMTITNTSDAEVSGNLVLSFPGMSTKETCGVCSFTHNLHEVDGRKVLEVVNSKNEGFCISVVGSDIVGHGSCLEAEGERWSNIYRNPQGTMFNGMFQELIAAGSEIDLHAAATDLTIYGNLTVAYNEPGASVSAQYVLAKNETKTVKFILTWYAPNWHSGGTPDVALRPMISRYGKEIGRQFTHMYAKQYKSAMEVEKFIFSNMDSIKKKIIAWQEVIYSENKIPGWLQDTLINGLYFITEDSVWAQKKGPVPDFICTEEDGAFGLCECPRGCPQIECIPCSFYGNWPVAFFFPEAALSTLRLFKNTIKEDGQITFSFGGAGVAGPYDAIEPMYGYQETSNAICYASMVDRVYQITNDKKFLEEFYESVKNNLIYSNNLNTGEDGIISFPSKLVSIQGSHEAEWFEASNWDGMAAHAGGLHLANILIVENMAKIVGDNEFATECRKWFEEGSKSMETKMWNEDGYYLNYYNDKTGNKSELIMGYQLDGDWISQLHGVGLCFDKKRSDIVLETIKKANIAALKRGAANFINPKSKDLATGGSGGLGGSFEYYAEDFFTPEAYMLAMTYIYAGEKDFGLEFARKVAHQLGCVLGREFNGSNIMQGISDRSSFGNDYYQNMIVWTIPIAMSGLGIKEYISSDDNLFRKILEAGTI